MRHTTAMLVLGGLLVEAPMLTAQDFRSVLQDLGPFPNASVTEPRAINDRGDVVGYAFVDGRDIAFLWTDRHGYEAIAENALPNDINNRGDVVGLLELCEAPECQQNGFLWNRRQGLQPLDAFAPFAINERGTIAGACTGTPPTRQPCVWERGTIASLDASGRAEGINARGDVVGVPAFFWSHRGVVTSIAEQTALEVLPRDINNQGEVVGTRTYLTPFRQQLTVWNREGAASPDMASHSVGLGINERGVAVGFIWSDLPPFAFVWHPTGRMHVLSAPGVISSRANDINNRGQIAVHLEYASGGSGVGVWQVRDAR